MDFSDNRSESALGRVRGLLIPMCCPHLGIPSI